MLSTKKICLYGTMLLMVLFAASCKPTSTHKLKVMSYNIHTGKDANNEDQLMKIAAFIKETGADIVGLQEVDSVCYRSGQVDQAKVLAKYTGMNYAFVRHFAFQGGSYGQALLSKYPITEVKNHRLPIFPDSINETRAFLTAQITLPTKNKWMVGVAHLDYRNSDSRIRQAELINEIYKSSDMPCILTGDMNAEPGTKEISILLENFQNTQPDDSHTFPTVNPIKKIDYILVGKSERIDVIDKKVYHVNYSDHLPIISVINIQE
ncbi:Metal-dependent hydrolase, endonuclease/exonuclease/phosphatase family [Mariniphaga anaerophila]|uniref:Metal-dependent hydrolase, endonuclease/exonuclease/phosphatase family n=1 Tax=Mariniphaga anaerophila TaxID=1484053 RepID=A0A1M5FVN1_9BACT|nr:endonuclease/exonuclease/phosphatase family protein [Mariniphaga anaerophila]SHF95548.1 Metal-dependent hydrolase, endonuclease/exonuclease/phosphatase family [Mariniphaga anaerophila]